MTDNTGQGLLLTGNRNAIPMLGYVSKYLICGGDCVEKYQDSSIIKYKLFLLKLKIKNPKYMDC
jgi:hypothetical protein